MIRPSLEGMGSEVRTHPLPPKPPTPVGVYGAVALALFFAQAAAAAVPELPRTYLDTAQVPPTGRTIAVNAGGDVQAALNSAQPGEVITLQAGATFTGPFTLPNKSGAGWITVRTSFPDSSLPPPNTRIDPSFASAMPKIVVAAGQGGAIQTASGAHHFRFVGIEITPAAGAFVYALVELGAGETSASALPHDIVFDRCYLHGNTTQGTRRGIAMNSASTAVIDSYLSGFAELGADSQALASWNGAGPFKIVNNYLEGAGENVMFGGADPSVPNLVPSDIEIRGNHFFKPLSWKQADPSYAGTAWSVKNLFELKNAQRVLVEGNVFENNWPMAQVGIAILFTVRNQDGTAPWSAVTDVTFRKNMVKNSSAGISISGTDDLHASQQTARILVQDNLFLNIDYRLFQVLNSTGPAPLNTRGGVVDLTIDHNTGRISGAAFLALGDSTAARDQHVNFVFHNNVTERGTYGAFGSGQSEGTLSLDTYCQAGYGFAKNAIIGAPAASYPANNFFPATLAAVGFVDPVNGNYQLDSGSAYKNAGSDGKDLGADFQALSAAIASTSGGPGDSKPGCGCGPGRPDAAALVALIALALTRRPRSCPRRTLPRAVTPRG